MAQPEVVYMYIHCTYTYMYTSYMCTCLNQSLRQGKAKQLYPKMTLPSQEKKEELPQAGLEPVTFCVLGRRSTNGATEAAQLGRPNL